MFGKLNCTEHNIIESAGAEDDEVQLGEISAVKSNSSNMFATQDMFMEPWQHWKQQQQQQQQKREL